MKSQYIVLGLCVISAICVTIGVLIGRNVHWPTQKASWTTAFRPQVQKLVGHMTTGVGRGLGWNWLANVTDTFGNRIVGSDRLENAIDFVVASLKAQGFDNVHTEDVPNLPRWIRGEENVTLLEPRNYRMGVLTPGGTVPTPPEGITAEAVVVTSFEEMRKLGRSKIAGKIVVYNEPWTTYGQTITGSEKPNEIVLLSGHFDSWDVGEGAMDDGGGCAVMWQALTAIRTLGIRPKRTIRVIFFTAEEIGYLGVMHYYQTHKSWTNETYVFVSESDEGVFKPTSQHAKLMFNGTDAAMSKLQDIANLIQSFSIPISIARSDDLGEVTFWTEEGIPGVIYLNRDTYDRYFIFHHTNADMMTVLRPDDLDYTSAVFATVAYVVANMTEALPVAHD